MRSIYHPTSGEKGFFCSIEEKKVIDAIINYFESSTVDVGDECLD